MTEQSNEHNTKYNEKSNHIYLEDLMRGLEQAVLELRDAIRIHDKRAWVGTIASVIGAVLGFAAIIFTTIVAVNTTRQFRAVGQRLDNIGERLDQLERRMTISEVSGQLVSKISDLYIEIYEREAVEAGYVEVTLKAKRYQINQKGRELLVAVSPKLKDRIIDEFVKSENTAEMVFKLHPEYLYELAAAYNKSNDPDISLRILIGVISAYAHSN
ncbi:hypothetical protein FJZ31_09600 [Candidatus Poribacteria bacterium]|nr:hypothetical protein [Candidatus Poribacteria bacterium]